MSVQWLYIVCIYTQSLYIEVQKLYAVIPVFNSIEDTSVLQNK